MTARIQGMGWVTPLGAGLEEVWARLAAGERGEVRELTRPGSPRRHLWMPVPAGLTKTLERQPRLRRSSAISLLTATAGLAALENAAIEMTPKTAGRTAVVFAIGDGGVIYTRKFYEGIVGNGANTASPLLFPETVYNAPASHVAALLGITGMSYTLVGDSSVGISALKFAEQLLETSDLDHVVVIGGEEIDWVLCEAYREWRLTRTSADGKGMLLSEGAAAIVVGRAGRFDLSRIHPGVPFYRREEIGAAIDQVIFELVNGEAMDCVIGGANGTFIDEPEQAALAKISPTPSLFFPKASLGEAPGASALMQTIVASLGLEHAGSHRALVSCPGLNQQASGLVLVRAG